MRIAAKLCFVLAALTALVAVIALGRSLSDTDEDRGLAYRLGEQTGAVIVPAAILVLGLTLYRRAKHGDASPMMSRRLTDHGITCGLLMLLLVEFPLELNPVEDSRLFTAIELLRVIIGIVGFALATAGLILRLKDRGTGIVRPLVAAALSFVHGGFGAMALVIASQFAIETNPQPWVFRIKPLNAELTLPSSEWTLFKERAGGAEFRHQRLPMRIVVSTRFGDRAALGRWHAELAATQESHDFKVFDKSEGTLPTGDAYTYQLRIVPGGAIRLVRCF